MAAFEHPLLVRIRERLAAHSPLEDHTDEARAAAVAIILRLRNSEIDVLFIKRAEYHLDPWSGQVAFPGGRHEPDDEDLLGTALRETREEIGVDLRGNFDLLGRLDDLHSQTVKLPNVFVRPYVIAVGELPPFHLSSEVAEAFWVPLSFLTTLSSWEQTSVQARGLSFEVRACLFDGKIIWGMTERILTQLLNLISEGR